LAATQAYTKALEFLVDAWDVSENGTAP
jgi:hypothetical protein